MGSDQLLGHAVHGVGASYKGEPCSRKDFEKGYHHFLLGLLLVGNNHCSPTTKGETQFPVFFSPTAESFGVSAQIGSGVVQFHEGCGVVRARKRATYAVGDIT